MAESWEAEVAMPAWTSQGVLSHPGLYNQTLSHKSHNRTKRRERERRGERLSVHHKLQQGFSGFTLFGRERGPE